MQLCMARFLHGARVLDRHPESLDNVLNGGLAEAHKFCISQEEIGCWLASYFGADVGERKSIWRQQLVDTSTPGGCSLLKRVMAMTGSRIM